MEETQMKIVKDTSKDCDLFSLLDRSKCFDVVASAVKDAVSDSVVDLKSPEVRMFSPVCGCQKDFYLLLSVIFSACSDYDIDKSYRSVSLLSCFLFLEYQMGR